MGILDWIIGPKQVRRNINDHDVYVYMKNGKYTYDIDNDKSPLSFNSKREAFEHAKNVIETCESMHELASIGQGNNHSYMGYDIEIIQDHDDTYYALVTEEDTNDTDKIYCEPGVETPEEALTIAHEACVEDYKLQRENGRPLPFIRAALFRFCYAYPEGARTFIKYVKTGDDDRGMAVLHGISKVYAKCLIDFYVEYKKILNSPVELKLDSVKEVVDAAFKFHEEIIEEWRRTHPKKDNYKPSKEYKTPFVQEAQESLMKGGTGFEPLLKLKQQH